MGASGPGFAMDLETSNVTSTETGQSNPEETDKILEDSKRDESTTSKTSDNVDGGGDQCKHGASEKSKNLKS